MSIADDDHDVLADLAAKQAIVEVLHRYCRALDRMDRSLADTVWHVGGTADYPPGYTGSAPGFLDHVWRYHARFASHSHLVGTAMIDVDLAAGAATSESYVSVWLRTAPVDGLVTDQFHRGRYVDRWSCRDGEWRIDHRTWVGDLFDEVRRPATSINDGTSMTGRRDRSDPSYDALG